MQKEVQQVISIKVDLHTEATPEQIEKLEKVLNAAVEKCLKKADDLNIAAVGHWAETKLEII